MLNWRDNGGWRGEYLHTYLRSLSYFKDKAGLKAYADQALKPVDGTAGL
jgi:hypothetical protein